MRRLLSLLVLAALLAACGGPAAPAGPTPVVPQPGVTPSAPGESEGAVISFAVWDYERSVYEPLADAFMAENPGITVVLVPLDDIANNPAATGPESPIAMLRRIVSAADTAPAIGLAPEAFGTPLLLDLKPLMDADPNFKADDFYPGAIERWTVKGGTWALPRYFYVQALNYNRDLFKLANVPEPEAGWTWEQLLATAEQVKAAGGGVDQTYGYLDNSGGFQPLMAILKEAGLDLLGAPAGEVRLDDQRIADSIDRVRQLYQDGVLYQPYQQGPNVQSQDPGELVSQGRVAIWSDVYIAGPDGQPAQPQGIDVGRVPFPADMMDPWSGPGSGGEGFMVSGGTSYPAESWKWIEWLSRQQIGQPGGEPGPIDMPGRIPARHALAEQTGFWEALDEQTAAAYRWALANPAPYSDRQPDYMTLGAISQAVSQVVSDPKVETSKALEDAQKWLDESLAQQSTTPTPEPDTSPVLVATPEPQTAPEGATTITFAVPNYSPSEIRRVVRMFREERPDIFVQIQATQVYTGPLLLQDVARTADCFTWGQVPTDAEMKALLDLQPLIDADAAFPKDDYPPAVLSVYQRGGATYGLPSAFNLRSLSYNRTAFDAAGIETPNVSWTPQDFLAAAQALTTGEGDQKQYGYVALSGVQTDLLFFIGQFGGRLTSGSGQDLRPTLTDPKTVEAIKWYLDLSKTHGVQPPVQIYYKRDDPGFEDKSFEYVRMGRAGMWFDTGYGMFSQEGGIADTRMGGPGIDPSQPAPSFEVGVSPLPVGSGGLRSGDFYARGMHISAGTENAQACWEWLKFLSSDVSTIYGDYPARISVAQGEAFTSQASPERLEIYEANAELLKRPGQPGDDPYVLYGGQLDSYWFFKAIMEHVKDDADLDAGLAEAQRLTTAFTECVAEGERPAVCAPKVDPDYQGFNFEDPSISMPKG